MVTKLGTAWAGRVSPPRRNAGRPRSSAGRTRGYLWFALPGVLLLGAVSLYPISLLVRMSFGEVRLGTLNKDWPGVGLANYLTLLGSPDFAAALGRTLFFVLIVAGIGVAGGLAAAMLLRTSSRISSLLLGLVVFVWALPPVVNGSVWKFLLAETGLVNSMLGSIGVGPFPFLFDPSWALASVALITSWAVVPFNALVFRSALLGLDPEIREAAAIDGANRWQEFLAVTLPGVRPTAIILAILTIVYGFRSFDFLYVMTAGGPGTSTTTLPYLSYNFAFDQSDFGLGSAVAVLTLLIVGGLAILYVRTTRSDHE